MKKKIWKCSIWVMLFLLLCTITSFWVEERLIPEVVSTVPMAMDEFSEQTKVPTVCVRTNEKGEQGVWAMQEVVDIWGGKQYRVRFESDVVKEIVGESATIKIRPEAVVVDNLFPLEDGTNVKKVYEKLGKEKPEPNIVLYLSDQEIDRKKLEKDIANSQSVLDTAFFGQKKYICNGEEVDVAYGNRMWLRERKIGLSESETENFFQGEKKALLHNHTADKLNVKKGDTILLKNTPYKVEKVYSNEEKANGFGEEIYVNQMPKGEEIPMTSVLVKSAQGKTLRQNTTEFMLKEYLHLSATDGKQYNLQDIEQMVTEIKWVCSLIVLFVILVILFHYTVFWWTKAYEEKKFRFTLIGIFLSGSGFELWYMLLNQCGIPQTFFSSEGILNIGVYADRIRTFSESIQTGAGENYFLCQIGYRALLNIEKYACIGILVLVLFLIGKKFVKKFAKSVKFVDI